MKTRGTEREKPDIGQPFHPTPALGSPIQTVGIKTCRFSLFSKPFSKFECSFFENDILGSFPNSFMQKSLFFNVLNELESR